LCFEKGTEREKKNTYFYGIASYATHGIRVSSWFANMLEILHSCHASKKEIIEELLASLPTDFTMIHIKCLFQEEATTFVCMTEIKTRTKQNEYHRTVSL
jgi:hypothetical protein